jgi:homogentisate 1,2-dioxygenase
MPHYLKLGKVPRFRHTTFYKEDGKSLYREELVSTIGFSGIYSNKYHIHMPTEASKITELPKQENVEWKDAPLQHTHFFTDKLEKGGDFLSGRVELMQNPHCKIYTAMPTENPDYFFRNAYAHEYIFVHHGSGMLTSDYGQFRFEPGDQLIIPKGIIYQMIFDNFENNKLFIVESSTPYEYPPHFTNDAGQFEEHAPISERDIKVPEFFDAFDKEGDFKLILKADNRFFEYTLPHHPYDVVGWDGYLYPFAINIKDYCPTVGKIHLPPPVHLLFQTQSFVVCNFVPRPFDFHPNAIPAPYYHHNVDSAEILYYVEGDFMSRSGVEEGSVTLHPVGIPHGPQPGKTEASVGTKSTEEYAVMVDTFAPIYPTTKTKAIMDKDYYKSWLT